MPPSRRIRILHVNFSLEPGGMENGVINVANRLPEAEFDVHFCCLERGGAFVERLRHPENVHVLHKRRGLSPLTFLKVALTLARVQPTLVHTHNLGPLVYAVPPTLFGWWKPILHGEHGQFQGDDATPRRQRQRRRLFRYCRRLHTVSAGLRQHMIEWGYPADRIVAIVNGVDTGRFAPADRAEARRRVGLPVEGPLLGIVGRFDPNKRHRMLAGAFERVAAAVPAARLVMVGDKGVEQSKIQELVAASPCRDRIHLAGFQADPVPYYQALDLLVAPSPFEGLSNVVLEAMACGVPVLGNQACGNAEVITHGADGYVAAVDSEESLAAELRRVLADPAGLARAGTAARAKMVARFSIDRMVADYAQLYRQVAAG